MYPAPFNIIVGCMHAQTPDNASSKELCIRGCHEKHLEANHLSPVMTSIIYVAHFRAEEQTWVRKKPSHNHKTFFLPVHILFGLILPQSLKFNHFHQMHTNTFTSAWWLVPFKPLWRQKHRHPNIGSGLEGRETALGPSFHWRVG